MDAVAPILELRGVSRRFPGVTAVDQVDFAVRPGEVHALLGENGAGKSTLIKIIGGALTRDSGEMLLDGRPVAYRSPANALADGIAVIYQELVLCPHLTVAENVLMGHLPLSGGVAINWPETRSKVSSILHQLGVSLPLNRRIERLSTAQQQLVEIAKALSRDSRILVLDEPSAALGRQDLEHLFAVIRRLRDRGVAIVYISHRLEEVFEIADRITVLRDGRLVGCWPLAEVDMRRLVRAMTGRELGTMTVEEPDANAPLRLELRSLGRKGIFEDFSVQLRAGAVVGIAGLVGSGRSEVLRAIFGADQPDSGEILIDGTRVRFSSPAQALRRGLGLLPEDRKSQGLLLNRALRENVALSSLARLSRFGVLSRRREERVVRGLMESLRIAARGPDQSVATLSGGNQQKAVLARWIARECHILLFDEPTRGVDIGAKEEIYRLIQDLARGGAAVLVVSSELKELFTICPRILVMREGRLVGDFSGDGLREEEVVAAMLLRGAIDGDAAVVAS
jgi:ABC-type sugar transport system ATPase subunit